MNDYLDYLQHHGIKGQKWGIRRYQNPDGSYTSEGRERRSSNKTQPIKRELTSKERMVISTRLRKLQNKFENEYLIPLWQGKQKEHPSPNLELCKCRK